jgi:hypothetical protein
MYTVAYGAPARACAARLLTSWGQHMPGVPVMVATDDPGAFGADVDCVMLERVDIGARTPKLRMYDAAPQDWDYVLYLDADIELMQPVDFMFRALAAGYDMVLTRNPDKYHVCSAMMRPNNREEVEETWDAMGGSYKLQWNGGVIAFRRSAAAMAVLSAWLTEWQRWAQQDQPALHRALWAHPCRVLTLGTEWNRSTRYEDGVEREIVRHNQMEAREMRGKLSAGVRGDSDTAWRALKGERRT